MDYILNPVTKLGFIMRDRDLNDPELGKMVGTSRQQIHKLRTGERRIGITWARRLARALSVKVDDVLEDENGGTPHAPALETDAAPTVNNQLYFEPKTPVPPLRLHEGSEQHDERDLVIYELATAQLTEALADGEATEKEWSPTGKWTMPYDMVQSHILPGTNLVVIRCYGDSMEPDYNSGDRVLIDRTAVIPTPPGVYLLWDGMGFILKRMELIPGANERTVRLSSSNPAHACYERPLNSLRIGGRVMGKWMWK